MFRNKTHFVLVAVSLVHLTSSWLYKCSDDSCEDCVSGGCRWCKRDKECHTPGSWLNPCKRAENIVDKSHCNDELSRYDPELSLKMLLLSSAAYDPQHPQECLNNALPSSKFTLKKVVTKYCDMFDHQCSGFVAISHVHRALAVAFRGTQSLTQALVEFVTVILSPKTPFIGGRVQGYWKNAFDVLWQDMDGEVKALVSTYPSYQIWVTGHSLGGAIASLASSWIANEKIVPRRSIILYTFGMPRVGNYDFALEHDRLVNNSWRVVNYNDAIPHFPTLASLKILGGPYHHGVEAFYSEVATSVYSQHKECNGKPYNEDATCSLSIVTRSIKHHMTYFSVPVGKFWKMKCVQ